MKENRLLPVQTMSLVVAAQLGVNIMIIQRAMVEIAGHDGWISVALAGLLSLGVSCITYALAVLYPELDFPGIFQAVWGKFFGKLLTIPLMAYLLVVSGIMLRVFADTIKALLLPETPALVVVGLMALVAISVVKRGIYAISAVTDMLFPIAVLPFAILILLSIQNWDYNRIQPILFENTANVLKGIIPGYRAYIGTGAILYTAAYTTEPKKTLKWYFAGMLISILFVTGSTLAVLLTFGSVETQRIVYPLISLSKVIEFPVTLLERLETLMSIIWILVVFAAITVHCFFSVRSFTVFFNVKPKHQNYVAYLHFPVLLIIAFLSESSMEAIEFYTATVYFGTFFKFAVVPASLCAGLIKKRREKR